jgi:hypothetical protein
MPLRPSATTKRLGPAYVAEPPTRGGHVSGFFDARLSDGRGTQTINNSKWVCHEVSEWSDTNVDELRDNYHLHLIAEG